MADTKVKARGTGTGVGPGGGGVADAPAGRESVVRRIAELEGELAEARERVAALVQKVEAGGATSPTSGAVADVAARLEELISARTSELEEKTLALEAANVELRNLTKNLDQIVRQRTRALAESEAQLRRKNVELDRLNRLKTDFISIAAHELRTPMTSIVGYLDLIIEGRLGELPADLRRPISSLRRNAHRLKRLVEDMLDVSRLEAGRVALRRAPFSLAELALSVVDEVKPLVVDKGQTVETEFLSDPSVDGDADRIHQVVANLVINAVKYTPQGGLIRLHIDVGSPPAAPAAEGGRPREWARLRVWDNGIGIPGRLRARLFEPFSDVQPAKHHTSAGPDSAGLGLHIARAIVDLHGGSITVDSEEGTFSEFTVLLPIADGGATEPDEG